MKVVFNKFKNFNQFSCLHVKISIDSPSFCIYVDHHSYPTSMFVQKFYPINLFSYWLIFYSFRTNR